MVEQCEVLENWLQLTGQTDARLLGWVTAACKYGIMMGEELKGKEDSWVEVAVQ